ncbi:MAG: hypothetical protein WBB28_01390 [Crinalium sp.]
MTTAPLVTTRVNPSDDRLDIFHPQTNAWTPAISPLQINGGFGVRLIEVQAQVIAAIALDVSELQLFLEASIGEILTIGQEALPFLSQIDNLLASTQGVAGTVQEILANLNSTSTPSTGGGGGGGGGTEGGGGSTTTPTTDNSAEISQILSYITSLYNFSQTILPLLAYIDDIAAIQQTTNISIDALQLSLGTSVGSQLGGVVNALNEINANTGVNSLNYTSALAAVSTTVDSIKTSAEAVQATALTLSTTSSAISTSLGGSVGTQLGGVVNDLSQIKQDLSSRLVAIENSLTLLLAATTQNGQSGDPLSSLLEEMVPIQQAINTSVTAAGTGINSVGTTTNSIYTFLIDNFQNYLDDIAAILAQININVTGGGGGGGGTSVDYSAALQSILTAINAVTTAINGGGGGGGSSIDYSTILQSILTAINAVTTAINGGGGGGGGSGGSSIDYSTILQSISTTLQVIESNVIESALATTLATTPVFAVVTATSTESSWAIPDGTKSISFQGRKDTQGQTFDLLYSFEPGQVDQVTGSYSTLWANNQFSADSLNLTGKILYLLCSTTMPVEIQVFY